ncbi:MAG: TetR/AcrR family transcriptional regulator [Candidatus Dormibacteraeota bacterium]|nr:TetR/AcrR family transcriptional regulator [Candidatus Dormibacteraeota bacterium]
MLATPVTPLERRRRRHHETIQEVLDVAVEVMGEQGVAGLSLGEVARRMGIRPPSLYVYFASKKAVYDAIFFRGASELNATMGPLHARLEASTDLAAYALEHAEVFLRWSIEHPVYAQLLFWRTVPNYEPSPEAYVPAVRMLEQARRMLANVRDRGLFSASADVDEVLRSWTMVITGVLTQQLANAPHESFDQGAFTTQLPQMVTMLLTHYGPRTPTTTTRRATHGNASRPNS